MLQAKPVKSDSVWYGETASGACGAAGSPDCPSYLGRRRRRHESGGGGRPRLEPPLHASLLTPPALRLLLSAGPDRPKFLGPFSDGLVPAYLTGEQAGRTSTKLLLVQFPLRLQLAALHA